MSSYTDPRTALRLAELTHRDDLRRAAEHRRILQPRNNAGRAPRHTRWVRQLGRRPVTA
jgi:hypothetical protein